MEILYFYRIYEPVAESFTAPDIPHILGVRTAEGELRELLIPVRQEQSGLVAPVLL